MAAATLPELRQELLEIVRDSRRRRESPDFAGLCELRDDMRTIDPLAHGYICQAVVTYNNGNLDATEHWLGMALDRRNR